MGDSGFGGKTSDAGRRRRMFAVVASSVTFGSITFGDEGGLTGKSGGLVFVVSVAALTRRFRGSGFFDSTFSGSSSLSNDLKPITKHVQKYVIIRDLPFSAAFPFQTPLLLEDLHLPNSFSKGVSL